MAIELVVDGRYVQYWGWFFVATFALESLGCKLNQAEIEALARELLRRGHQLAETAQQADVYVLNTCTVTHVADRKSRHALRLARRRNSRAVIVALGCYARRASEDLLGRGIADRVLTSRETGEIAELLEGGVVPKQADGRIGIGIPWSRTRSFVKVQEGCTNFCSFCIVPYVRQPVSTRPVETILREVRARTDAGVKEIVLTGTRIGDYRWNGWRSRGLTALIKAVLRDTEVPRLRLTSLGPSHLSADMLELWADQRLCPHLHLPLQSGSEAVLKRMNRPYSLDEYVRGVERARKVIPDLAITTDILVGFPGETDEQFEETHRFCSSMGFAGIHVFTFSARNGTVASSLPDQIGEGTKKERSVRMLDLAALSSRAYSEGFIGRTMEVLWEKSAGGTTWDGLTANYLRVYADDSEDLSGRLLPARLVAGRPGGLVGELVYGGGNG